MDEQEVIRMAQLAGAEFKCDTLLVNGKDAHDFLVLFANFTASAEHDRTCASIKEEGDHRSTGDYMLDSDDCIRVARGEWQRPEYN